VWVDGVKVTTINANNTAIGWEKTYTSPPYTGSNSHTIVIRNISPDGTYIDVDAIVIN
jgi:hypothetical protein